MNCGTYISCSDAFFLANVGNGSHCAEGGTVYAFWAGGNGFTKNPYMPCEGAAHSLNPDAVFADASASPAASDALAWTILAAVLFFAFLGGFRAGAG